MPELYRCGSGDEAQGLTQARPGLALLSLTAVSCPSDPWGPSFPLPTLPHLSLFCLQTPFCLSLSGHGLPQPHLRRKWDFLLFSPSCQSPSQRALLGSHSPHTHFFVNQHSLDPARRQPLRTLLLLLGGDPGLLTESLGHLGASWGILGHLLTRTFPPCLP